jgi:hypothetical protein
MNCELLGKFNITALGESIQELLLQSSLACEAGNGHQMLVFARAAQQVALACGDSIGEAISLCHLATGHIRTRECDRAITAFQQAVGIFHRHPTRLQRRHEGIALFGLALSYRQQQPPAWIQAIACYQRSIDVLERILAELELVGNDRGFREIHGLLQEVRDRMLSEIPQVYLDTQDYGVSTVSSGISALAVEQTDEDSNQLNEHRGDVANVRQVPDDQGLVNARNRPDDVETQEIADLDDQLARLGRFSRDDRGNVIFVKPDRA